MEEPVSVRERSVGDGDLEGAALAQRWRVAGLRGLGQARAAASGEVGELVQDVGSGRQSAVLDERGDLPLNGTRMPRYGGSASSRTDPGEHRELAVVALGVLEQVLTFNA
ncbi:hypothetical protein [Streptomyces capparidis]